MLDKKNLISIIYSGVLIVISIIFWTLLRGITISSSGSVGISIEIILAGLISIFFISLLLVFNLIPDNWLYLGFLAVTNFIISQLVFSVPIGFILIVTVIGTLAFLAGYYAVHKKLKITIKFSALTSLAVAYELVMISLIVALMSGIYWYRIDNEQVTDLNFQSQIDRFLSDKILAAFDKNYEEGMSVDEYLGKEIDNSQIDEIKDAEPEQKTEWIGDNREKLADTFQVDIKGKDKFKSVITEYINNKIIEQFQKIPKLLAISYALFVVVIILIIRPILKIVVLGVSSLIVKALIRFNVFELEIKKVDKEELIV